MDYELAMAIFHDAASRSMRRGGRVAWSEEDYNVGVDAFNACLPRVESSHDRA
jgi:hypothetical protein